MRGVVRIPYMDTQLDRLMREVARGMGRDATYNKAPVGVYFGTPGVEAEDPYFGGEGPRRRGCISCGNCMIGCGHNAKNKLTVNYLYLAEKHGAENHELQEVYEVKPLADGGFEVHARHSGWLQRAAHLHHQRYTAAQVIVSAHAYGSAKLLHHLKHEGTLSRLPDRLPDIRYLLVHTVGARKTEGSCDAQKPSSDSNVAPSPRRQMGTRHLSFRLSGLIAVRCC